MDPYDVWYPGMGMMGYDPDHGAAYEWNPGHNELYPHWPDDPDFVPFGVMDVRNRGVEPRYFDMRAPYRLDSMGGVYDDIDWRQTSDNAMWDMMPDQDIPPGHSQWVSPFFNDGLANPYDNTGYRRWSEPGGGNYGYLESVMQDRNRGRGGVRNDLAHSYYLEDDDFGVNGLFGRGRRPRLRRHWADELNGPF